mgnify:CR=1 FL=1
MPKKKDTFFNMVISLIAITIIAGFALGFVNKATVGPIAKAKLERKINALKLVLPRFDNNPVSDVQKIKSEKTKDSVELFPAYLKNEFIGAAVIGVTDKGFSGIIKIMVGFKPNGDIQNMVVLEQKETPGLGTKIKDENFLKQFREKNLAAFNVKVTKDGGEVDALTGATITSRAFGDAVQMAYDEFVKNNKDFNK